jgi:hypothetical protein
MALITDSPYREQAEAEPFPGPPKQSWYLRAYRWFSKPENTGLLPFLLVFIPFSILVLVLSIFYIYQTIAQNQSIRDSKVCIKNSVAVVVAYPSGQVSEYRRFRGNWIDYEGDYVSSHLDEKIRKVQRKCKAWGGCSCKKGENK